MDLSTFSWLVAVISLFLIILLITFKWLIKEIREVCYELLGYVKLNQLILTGVTVLIFLAIFVNTWLYPTKVEKIDLFLTVIVGFLGTMIGYFFKEGMLERIEKERREKTTKHLEITEMLKERLKKYRGERSQLQEK